MMLTNTLRAVLLAAGLALAACTAPAPGGFDSPQALLDDIYGQYADQPAGSGIDLAAPGIVARYFTPETAALIEADTARAKAANDVPVLDGDPFVGSQDWQITDLDKAVAKSAEPDKTMAIVKFMNYGQPAEVKLHLALSTKGWQIADIDWGYDTLTKILQE
ncbi:MAG: DUF3828 domain-containing protein [Rhodospirillaceae bacterium]|nr:DUF3828 domain-containing protein [Rhodospirillaceae bacterium]